MTFFDPLDDAKRANARTQFGLTQAQLGWQRGNIDTTRANETASLQQQFAKQREALPGSFANRGLLNSGIYAQGVYQFNQNKANAFRDQAQKFSEQYGNNDFAQQQAGVTRDSAIADSDAATAAGQNQFNIDAQEKIWQAEMARQVRAVQ